MSDATTFTHDQIEELGAKLGPGIKIECRRVMPVDYAGDVAQKLYVIDSISLIESTAG